MNEEINENTVERLMWEAVEKKDERRIKEVILKAMEVFLENPDFIKENLETVAISYLTVPIELHQAELKIKDRKLHYVLQELSAVSVVPDKRAKENVRCFILYLKGKDYEKTGP